MFVAGADGAALFDEDRETTVLSHKKIASDFGLFIHRVFYVGALGDRSAYKSQPS